MIDRTWFSEDGLMRLDPYPMDSQTNPYKFPQATVLNENGMLFLGIYVALGGECDWFIETYSALCREPGLICRLPNNFVRHDAQDNQIGAILGGLKLGYLSIPEEINNYGKRTGYNYNNVEPGVWKLEQQRQGGDIALFKIAAGEKPAWWQLVWLVVGLVLSLYSKPDPSRDQLAWCRVRILEMKGWLLPLVKLFDQRVGTRGIKSYYKQWEHPNMRLVHERV